MLLICGEALYDLIGSGAADHSEIHFEGQKGGSALNVAVGLARLGESSALFCGISSDHLGQKLVQALKFEGVDTQFLIRSSRPTTIALVNLDVDGHPQYVFYGNDAADRCVSTEDLPVISDDIRGFHFGSYSIVVEPVATAFGALAEREASKFISFDPNVRLSIEPDLLKWRSRIDKIRTLANLVKVSDEDLRLLYPGMDPIAVATKWSREGPSMVILTRGGNEIIALRGDDEVRIFPPTISVKDSVGAGDAFQASLLASIFIDENPIRYLEEVGNGTIAVILKRAAEVAAFTCTKTGAVLPFADDLQKKAAPDVSVSN